MEELQPFVRNPVDIDSLTDKELIFQAISWCGQDIEIFSNNEDECEDVEKNYQIYIHGITRNGESVCLRVMNFIFYLYVEIPERYQRIWGFEQTNILYNYLKKDWVKVVQEW